VSDFVEKLRLKGMAEEDLYFARRDRELIAALRKRTEAGRSGTFSAVNQSSTAAGIGQAKTVTGQRQDH